MDTPKISIKNLDEEARKALFKKFWENAKLAYFFRISSYEPPEYIEPKNINQFFDNYRGRLLLLDFTSDYLEIENFDKHHGEGEAYRIFQNFCENHK